MKQSHSQNRSIAWFKLHHFVQRGEKEKAIGICKLLIPSIDDFAFACKLEGDLLYAFNDIEHANEKYILAAKEYLNNNQHDLALELCKNLEQEKLTIKNIFQLAKIYFKANSYIKSKEQFEKLIDIAFDHKNKELLSEIIFTAKELSKELCIQLNSKILITAIQDKYEHKFIEKIICCLVECYKKTDSGFEFNKFISTLRAIDEEYYNLIIKLLDENKI